MLEHLSNVSRYNQRSFKVWICDISLSIGIREIPVWFAPPFILQNKIDYILSNDLLTLRYRVESMGHTRPLFVKFSVFSCKQYKVFNNFLLNIQLGSICCRDLNSRPFEFESLPLSTRPGLPPNLRYRVTLKIYWLMVSFTIYNCTWSNRTGPGSNLVVNHEVEIVPKRRTHVLIYIYILPPHVTYLPIYPMACNTWSNTIRADAGESNPRPIKSITLSTWLLWWRRWFCGKRIGRCNLTILVEIQPMFFLMKKYRKDAWIKIQKKLGCFCVWQDRKSNLNLPSLIPALVQLLAASLPNNLKAIIIPISL